jgi:UDP-glucose 4-epimerase
MPAENPESTHHRNSLSGRKVVVTGASGFIGTHLCSELLRQGADVYAFSREKRSDAGDQLHRRQVDLTDGTTVQKALSAIRPSTVFHLAGYPVGARTLEQVIPTFSNNLTSTVNLLTSAAEVGSRILVAGSLEEPDTGNPEIVPSSPYAASKWASSAYARMFHALFNLPVVMMRIFMVYGPGQQDRTKLVPYTIKTLLQGKPPKLTSGKRKIDWIYVQDVVDGFIHAARARGIDGQTIDLGSGKLVSIRTVVKKLVYLINPKITPLFGALADRPFEQERVADVERSFALLGWRPQTPLHRGLELTVSWYRQQVGAVN